MRIARAAILAITVCSVLQPPHAAAQVTLRSHVFSSGAVEVTGDGHTLRGTIGQPIVGTVTSASQTVRGGFWYQVYNAGPQIAPVAADDHVATNVNEPVDINVLRNDSDPGGSVLSITAFSDPSNGTVVQKSDSVLTYTPADGFRGLDSLDYSIENTNGLTATARVRISVGEENRPPEFVSTPVTGVTIGDIYRYVIIVEDPDGDPVAVSAMTLPEWLVLEHDEEASGVLTGSPSIADTGVHTVTLSATDGIDSTFQAFSVTVVEGVPAVVHLFSPAHEAEDVSPEVMLQWNSAAGAGSYHLLVSTSHDLSDLLVDAPELADTTYQLHSLEPLTTYFWQVRGVNGSGEGEPSSTNRFVTAAGVSSAPNQEIPDQFFLAQNYPNPFNPSTVIAFHMPDEGDVYLAVFDVFGREIVRLVDERRAAGRYEIVFDAGELASGLYVYRLDVASKMVDTRKMLLVR